MLEYAIKLEIKIIYYFYIIYKLNDNINIIIDKQAIHKKDNLNNYFKSFLSYI